MEENTNWPGNYSALKMKFFLMSDNAGFEVYFSRYRRWIGFVSNCEQKDLNIERLRTS
jgi:hypothetical protein